MGSRSEPLTSAEVAERLEAHRDWSFATIKTMLSRLAGKGAISDREDGRRFLSTPRQSSVRPMSEANSKRFVERLFGGRPPLVARLAEEDGLDAKDIAEIEKLLKELKG